MSDEAIAVFQVEARENLELIEQGLLDLLDRPEDRDLVDAVFRGLHTLKGSGSMFGFDALAGFTHHCETAFDRVRKGEVAATTDLVSAVLAARDHMRRLMEDPTGDHGAAPPLPSRRPGASGSICRPTPSRTAPIHWRCWPSFATWARRASWPTSRACRR